MSAVILFAGNLFLRITGKITKIAKISCRTVKQINRKAALGNLAVTHLL